MTVIGKRACRVPREEGWDYIVGLTARKDLSGRTIQTRGALPQISRGQVLLRVQHTGPWLSGQLRQQIPARGMLGIRGESQTAATCPTQA